MSYIYKNIIGDTATELVSLNEVDKVTSIKIANVKSSGVITVDLYLYKMIEDVPEYLEDLGIIDTTKIFYIMRNNIIKSGSYLLLENNEITFDNSLYSLYIKLNTVAGAADIIIDAIPVVTVVSEPEVQTVGGSSGGGDAGY